MTYYNTKINHYHYFNSELSAYYIKTEIIWLEPYNLLGTCTAHVYH